MAHFAQIDENNIVLQVIVVADEDCAGGNFPDSEIAGAYFCNRLLGGRWKQTSYNSNFRKNYAGIGFEYREDLDAFIPPKPFSSWILNEETCLWEPPISYPEDGEMYRWDEETLNWILITFE